MVDSPLPAEQANAVAAAHNPTAQPGPATAAPAAAAGAPVTPEAAPTIAAVEQPKAVEAASVAPDAPKLDKTLLEKFDDEQKATEAAKVAEAKPAEKSAEAKPGETALEPKKDEKAAEAKPGEKKADEAAKPAEAKPVEPAAPASVAYEYKLPDTLKMDDALKGKVHAAFDAFRADPVKGPQALIDLHAQTMADFAKSYDEQAVRNQFDVFNKTKAGWETEWLADEEIGGNGHTTALKAIARARDELVSSAPRGTPKYEADRKEFEKFLAVTGAGSHPAFARMMHNASRYTDEPQADNAPLTDLKPPKGNGRTPGSRLYDHPSSQKVART